MIRFRAMVKGFRDRGVKMGFGKLNKGSFDFLNDLSIESITDKGDEEGGFEEHYPVMYREVEEQIENLFEEKKGRKDAFSVLECGVGTGGHAFRILDRFPDVS